MTGFDRFENFTGDEKSLRSVNKERAEVYNAYWKSVVDNGNPVLCVECFGYVYGNGDMDKITDALDFWGVDEFVLYGGSGSIFETLDFLCDNGWRLDGTMRVKMASGSRTPGVKIVRG